MSDPVSSMDVEDVLSSIRRLVSEESKAAAPSRESNDAVDDGMRDIPEESADGSIEDSVAALLKRRLKVAAGDGEGVPPSNDSADDASDDDTEMAAEAEAGTLSGEDTVRPLLRAQTGENPAADDKLVLTAALRVVDDPAEKTRPVPLRPTRPERSERLHLRRVAEEAEAVDESEAEVASQGRQSARGRLFTSAPEEQLFDRASRAMDAADQKLNRIRPVTPPADVPAAQTETIVDDQPVQDELQTDTPDLQAHETPFAPASPFRRDGGFGARTLHSFSSQTEDQTPEAEKAAAVPETDTDVDDTNRPVEDEDEPSTINFAEQDDSILDEDSLRDMISQMVREELQGELGDRITRNVRKLVRREIQRALASREFE